MNSLLNVTTKILAFSDKSESSNPRLKSVDWYRDMSGQTVVDPRTETFSLAPNESKTVFDGTETTSLDGTSAFDLTLSTLDSSKYRLTYVGGTNPAWRTGRGLTLNGVAVTFTVNSNMTVTVTVPTGPDFTAVQIGDIVFIPHTTTGDSTSPVSVLNAGYWKVLSKASSTSITLARTSGVFEAAQQTVTLTSNSQFRAFSSTGVQIGDSIYLAAGFAIGSRKTFEVLAVTDTFIEFVSSIPLAVELGVVPGVDGILFFDSSKNFLYIESDAEVVVQCNTDTSYGHKLESPDISNSDWPAQYLKRGPTWKLTIVNTGADFANVFVIHAE